MRMRFTVLALLGVAMTATCVNARSTDFIERPPLPGAVAQAQQLAAGPRVSPPRTLPSVPSPPARAQHVAGVEGEPPAQYLLLDLMIAVVTVVWTSMRRPARPRRRRGWFR